MTPKNSFAIVEVCGTPRLSFTKKCSNTIRPLPLDHRLCQPPGDMKKVSPYLKMKVLGALEFAEGESVKARCIHVSGRIFKDEEGNSFQFTWRTIQTWLYYYNRDGVTKPAERNDKGTPRKATPEELLDAIEQALPFFQVSATQ